MSEKKKVLLIFILFIIIGGALIAYLMNLQFAKISTKVLGNETLGSVEKIGVYGNPISPVKIAYIVGVHPLENQTHQAVFESIKSKDSSLKYSYYIYKVNVTHDSLDYEKGRMNGQLLASRYTVPDIKKQNFALVVDVHSNVGNYDVDRFLYIPASGTAAESLALHMTNKLLWLTIYNPPNSTSTKYVTIPLINSGIPAIVYETYLNQSEKLTRQQADELVAAVDNLKF
ncbi:MAG: hypothetical protein Q8N08_07020 [Methanobacteriaceae archaeon]|nr:hypothetical protein [Methanobacteriaceae archaeon]